MKIESIKYEQTRYLENLNYELYNAQNPNLYPLADEPESVGFFGLVGMFFVVVLIPTVFIGGLIAAGLYFLLAFVAVILEIFSVNATDSFYLTIIFAPAVIVFIYFFYIYTTNAHDEESQRKSIISENNTKRANNNKILKNSSERAQILKSEIAQSEQNIRRTEDILKEYYSLNILHKKYRGLVPVTMLFEYFDTGVCTVLEGHDGAYKLYDNQILMKIIIDNLVEINQNLYEIKRNQYTLANLLENSNQMICCLTNAASKQASILQRIEDNQEIANYYNRINAENTEFIKWLEIFRY